MGSFPSCTILLRLGFGCYSVAVYRGCSPTVATRPRRTARGCGSGRSRARSRKIARRARDEQIAPRRRSLAGPIAFEEAQQERYNGSNVVERCFNKLRRRRGIAMRSDKASRVYGAAIALAARLIWIKTDLIHAEVAADRKARLVLGMMSCSTSDSGSGDNARRVPRDARAPRHRSSRRHPTRDSLLDAWMNDDTRPEGSKYPSSVQVRATNRDRTVDVAAEEFRALAGVARVGQLVALGQGSGSSSVLPSDCTCRGSPAHLKRGGQMDLAASHYRGGGGEGLHGRRVALQRGRVLRGWWSRPIDRLRGR